MNGNNQNYNLIKRCFKCGNKLRVKLDATIIFPADNLNKLDKQLLMDHETVLEINWKNQTVFCQLCNWQKNIRIQEK